MAWILGNAAITGVYCFICYSTDAKFQIAVAKLLTVFYSITMTAMIIGLIVEFANKGFLAPNAVSLLSFLDLSSWRLFSTPRRPTASPPSSST